MGDRVQVALRPNGHTPRSVRNRHLRHGVLALSSCLLRHHGVMPLSPVVLLPWSRLPCFSEVIVCTSSVWGVAVQRLHTALPQRRNADAVRRTCSRSPASSEVQSRLTCESCDRCAISAWLVGDLVNLLTRLREHTVQALSSITPCVQQTPDIQSFFKV